MKGIITSDSHVHTAFSTDSKEPMEQMLMAAINNGYPSICFTDHMDFNFPLISDDSSIPLDKPPFLLDMDAYFSEIQRLMPLYPQIKIRTGIELGLKEDAKEQCAGLLNSYKFDFVIGSTHLVDNTDPYYDIFWEGTNEKTAIQKFYDATLENAKSGVDFDVYGHIDYITRYTPYMKKLRSSNLFDEDYYTSITNNFLDIIEAILKELINNGKGIELNTSGFKYGLHHPHPHEKILKLYKELGGEIITIGSDAHEAKHLGLGFDDVPEILKTCGFKYYTEFTGRRPEMLPIY
ncbi:MAG: histidinol-phosphatase HisJ family protein [Lachnospiraceae bacterium]|nr:histidinol-phosphatase HisJ family protein [Lachnospiraceae bacterium]